MSPFIVFMASKTGYIVRMVAGLALVVWGWFGVSGTTGMIFTLIGLVPPTAGLLDFCVFAPLFDAPLNGISGERKM